MITVVFNGLSNQAIELLSFNRNTSFESGSMNSMAYLNVKNTAGTADTLRNLGLNGITNMVIYDGETAIYRLTDLNAHITSINESLNGNVIDVNVNIVF